MSNFVHTLNLSFYAQVKDAVITVPAYFNDTQREATKLAGKMAGFNILKIISEPVAAALAFGFSTNEQGDVLVYDLGKRILSTLNISGHICKILLNLIFILSLSIRNHNSGGGTFDIAIVSINEVGMYHVRSTNGNTRLGGAKFVDRLLEFCFAKLNIEGSNLSSDELSVLRAECEKVKKQLSIQTETIIVVSEQEVKITRQEFDEMISPYIDQTIECVKNALQDAELEAKDISKIIMVGGATLTPLVRKRVETFFGKAVYTDLNPMDAGKLKKMFRFPH